MSCPCDILIHPPTLNIPAGLSCIPRQIATFLEFRKAMFAALRSNNPLIDWRARGKDDLGIMLLEMWAYVCDDLAFYDEVIAHEAYLRTARRRTSLRKLVDLLGYLPRPAVAAYVKLAFFADGRQPVTLPAGTSFRSSAFDNEPPQVFELNTQAVIHPLTNHWNIEAPRSDFVSANDPAFLLIKPTAELVAGNPLFIRVSGNPAQNQVAILSSVENQTGTDGNRYMKANFNSSTTLSSEIALSQISLMVPTQTAALWTVSASPPAITSQQMGTLLPVTPFPLTLISGGKKLFSAETASHLTISSGGTYTLLTLDSLYRQIKPGDFVLLSRDGEYRWFQVIQVEEVMRQPTSTNTVTINKTTFNMANVTVPVTQLLLDTIINDASRKTTGTGNWDNSHRKEIIIHFGMQHAGNVVVESKTTLAASDPLKFMGIIETPADSRNPNTFLLEDKNQLGVLVGGSINFQTGTLTLNMNETWQPPLTLPVDVYGNIASASRGESVLGEVLGSGDASQANQSFKLKKKPLTYLPSPTVENDQGVANILRVYVDGILWQEVATFFNTKSDAQVYIVRQNDKGESIVTFGDGMHGARLSTGTNNVVAYYRYGAGAANPPAGSITQIAKPVKGLQSVKNPLAAYGGDDAESSKNIRSYAPRSALILGRAVSIQDMEAVASGVPGVRAVKSEWRWHGIKQCAVVNISYIGEKGIEATILQRLRSVTDPSTPFNVEFAQAIPVILSIDIEINPCYQEEKVLKEVRMALMNKESGILAPENIGIGKPLYRSQIFEAVLKVPGTLAIRNIQWDNLFFNNFAHSPGSGKYFDLEQGELVLNGRKDDNG